MNFQEILYRVITPLKTRTEANTYFGTKEKTSNNGMK
jgi:hypothetical protein